METVPPPGTVRDLMLQILSDGQRHHSTELHRECCSPMTELRTVTKHISNLRKYVKTQGLDIVCVLYHRNFYFQLVRVLHNNE